jgi:hypothetical protein
VLHIPVWRQRKFVADRACVSADCKVDDAVCVASLYELYHSRPDSDTCTVKLCIQVIICGFYVLFVWLVVILVI